MSAWLTATSAHGGESLGSYSGYCAFVVFWILAVAANTIGRYTGWTVAAHDAQVLLEAPSVLSCD